MKDTTPQREPIAHPYVRISGPEQRKGSGIARQTVEAAPALAEFCKQYGFDQSKTIMVDDGVSAFRGRHLSPDHELGKFLDKAERGLVLPGDCLVIENWDRLSRQNIWAAVGLVNDLRQLGIHIGRLDRMKLLHCESTDPGDFFEAAVELMRGHGESNRKSELVGKAWKLKREAAIGKKEQPPRKKDGRVTKSLTDRLPAWIEDRGGKLRLIPRRAAIVKRIFKLAAAGYGHGLIVKKLTEDGVPPFGDYVTYTDDKGKTRRKAAPGGPLGSGRWQRAYVAKILRDRRAAGDFVPSSRGGKAGETIPGYYPAAVTEELWTAARAAAVQRDRLPGRKRAGRGNKAKLPGGRRKDARDGGGSFVNLLDGLLLDARHGGTFYLFYRSQGRRSVINSEGFERRQKIVTFPLDVLEPALLRCLKGIDPREALNGDGGPDESLSDLRKEFDAVEVELAEASAFMDEHGFSPTIGRRVAALEERQKELALRLDEARRAAAHPLSETWGEAKALMDALASEDARVRLRSALRRMVESVHLLVIPRGRDRLAAAQVTFAGAGRFRNYLILSRPASGNARAKVPASWWVYSAETANLPGKLDLRKREDVAELEAILAGLDTDPLTHG
jgi:DNA invertase Pin-like site-specific DNA recombinase